MAQHEHCDKCGQKESCQDVFRRLGNTQGKSIARHVLAAFVVPLVIFISALAAAQWLLEKYIDSDGLQAAIALLIAIAVAAVCVTTIRMTGKWLSRK